MLWRHSHQRTKQQTKKLRDTKRPRRWLVDESRFSSFVEKVLVVKTFTIIAFLAPTGVTIRVNSKTQWNTSFEAKEADTLQCLHSEGSGQNIPYCTSAWVISVSWQSINDKLRLFNENTRERDHEQVHKQSLQSTLSSLTPRGWTKNCTPLSEWAHVLFKWILLKRQKEWGRKSHKKKHVNGRLLAHALKHTQTHTTAVPS